MKNDNKEVYILGGMRTPFVRSFTNYVDVKIEDLMLAPLKELVRVKNLQGKKIGDVALGTLIKNPNSWGISRECVLKSGLHPETPAYLVQRACGTSLEAVIQIALKISAGQIESGIAGGVDTNSDIPLTLPSSLTQKLMALQGAKSLPEKIKAVSQLNFKDIKPQGSAVVEKLSGLSMGEHCELMVKEWEIPRQEQDQIAFNSHQNAAKAYEEGFFSDLVMPYKNLSKDTILRKETSLEKLATLKPAFDKKSGKGTLTAGNSTALTDGAAVVLLGTKEFAEENGLEVQARIVDGHSAAVNFQDGEGLLMAPVKAIVEILKRNKLALQDFDFYEIHEAFAGQVLCTLKALESDKFCQKFGAEKALGSVDRSKLNIHGSSLAFGHPFSATGARITATLAKVLKSKGKGRGLISICTAGGMGVVMIVES
ncbi:MAG: acetyl-CoA C-acetyltransferase [Bacteriovoracaceae bacterium]|nr:acetyl-CoA C-acetyltransferase [Bacteriovoracaceae bacterium]